MEIQRDERENQWKLLQSSGRTIVLHKRTCSAGSYPKNPFHSQSLWSFSTTQKDVFPRGCCSSAQSLLGSWRSGKGRCWDAEPEDPYETLAKLKPAQPNICFLLSVTLDGSVFSQPQPLTEDLLLSCLYLGVLSDHCILDSSRVL